MKLLVLFSLLFSVLSIAFAGERGVERRIFARNNIDDCNTCNVSYALDILEHLSKSGEAFCTSLLHTSKRMTTTKSVVVITTVECSVTTKTTTEHATFTSTVYGKSTTLPQLTFTSYSSTVLIPSGSKQINKRNNLATPTSLSTCRAPTLSTACSSLLAPSTTTTTATSTHTKHQCLSTAIVTVTTIRHTVTSKIPFIITPPPVSVPGTGILTTTVPADCISGPYSPPADNTPDGDLETFAEYPYQPGTSVECCVACHHSLNCIASSYYPPGDECAFLIRIGSPSGVDVSDICPLGVQDYDFGEPTPDGTIVPGPCGM